MGPKIGSFIFLGYHCHSGGKWSKDYFVLAVETFSSAIDMRGIEAIRCSDIVVPNYFEFHVASGKVTQPGESIYANDQL